MAYELVARNDGSIEVRCTSGRSAVMRTSRDGRWTVDEDKQGRHFSNRGEALDCCREIARDPDFK